MSKENLKQKNSAEDKRSRPLHLNEELKEEFNSIKKFGNFERWTFNKKFHYFYSVAVAYSAQIISAQEEDIIKITLNNLKEIPNKIDTASIYKDQLAHHDDLFKCIAYWLEMKKGNKKCYEVLIKTNEARRISEMFFQEKWKEFKEIISNYSSKFPDIQLLDLLEIEE